MVMEAFSFLTWAGRSFTRPGCSRPHRTWTLPGIWDPQFFRKTCSSASRPISETTFFLLSNQNLPSFSWKSLLVLPLQAASCVQLSVSRKRMSLCLKIQSFCVPVAASKPGPNFDNSCRKSPDKCAFLSYCCRKAAVWKHVPTTNAWGVWLWGHGLIKTQACHEVCKHRSWSNSI